MHVDRYHFYCSQLYAIPILITCHTCWPIVLDLALCPPEPKCPDGYKYFGQLSDGTTCFGDNKNVTSGPASFTTSNCSDGSDMLRERWTPKSTKEVEEFLKAFG